MSTPYNIGHPNQKKGESKHSPELRALLRAEWLAGTVTAAIGEKLGLSKNAIVGLAHRMGLPERPSPLKSPWGSKKARVEATEASCQWIDGEPSDPKCGAPGYPYCPDHAARTRTKAKPAVRKDVGSYRPKKDGL
jgi:GcrA cell cycle regulator